MSDYLNETDTNSILSRLNAMQAEIDALKKRDLSVDSLDDISPDMGTITDGELRVGNGLEPGTGFSGLRILYPPWTDTDGKTYVLVANNNDVFTLGIDVSDGSLVWGQQVGRLNEKGFLIVEGTAGGELGQFDPHGTMYTDADGNQVGTSLRYLSNSSGYRISDEMILVPSDVTKRAAFKWRFINSSGVDISLLQFDAASKTLKLDGVAFGAPKAAIFGNINTTVPASTTVYTAPGMTGTINDFGVASFIIPFTGVIKNFRLRLATAQPGSGSLVVAINNDAAMRITIEAGTGATTVIANTSDTLTVNAGDVMRIYLINNATAASGKITGYSFELDPS